MEVRRYDGAIALSISGNGRASPRQAKDMRWTLGSVRQAIVRLTAQRIKEFNFVCTLGYEFFKLSISHFFAL